MLGKVLDAVRVPGKGVRIVARVDNQPESSPLRHLYEQVKKGTLNGLSVGGFFKRVMTAAGPRIADVDLTEWSITGVPVGRRTNFGVVAQKALEDVVVPDGITIPQVDGEIRAEGRGSDPLGAGAARLGVRPNQQALHARPRQPDHSASVELAQRR